MFENLAHPEMPLIVADRFLRLAGIPKLNYLCRVGFPGEYSEALQSFDEQVVLAQSGMWRTPLPPDAAMQARSPLRNSGMATPRVEEIAPFAFLSAVANASYALLHAFPAGNLPPRFLAAVRAARGLVERRTPPDLTPELVPPRASIS